MVKRRINILINIFLVYIFWIPLGLLGLAILSLPYYVLNLLGFSIGVIILIYLISLIVMYYKYRIIVNSFVLKLLRKPNFKIVTIDFDQDRDNHKTTFSLSIDIKPNNHIKTLSVISVGYSGSTLDWLNSLTYRRQLYNRIVKTIVIDTNEFCNLSAGMHIIRAGWDFCRPIECINIIYKNNYDIEYKYKIVVENYM